MFHEKVLVEKEEKNKHVLICTYGTYAQTDESCNRWLSLWGIVQMNWNFYSMITVPFDSSCYKNFSVPIFRDREKPESYINRKHPSVLVNV